MKIDYNHYPYRNWCPDSEPITGLDSFLSALDNGWYLTDRTCLEIACTRSGRFIQLYQCRVRKAGRSAYINIVANPRVLRVLLDLGLTIVTLYQSEGEEDEKIPYCDREDQKEPVSVYAMK